MAKTVSKETSKILRLGESLRENPRTILLSIPVFSFGYAWHTLLGNKEKQAGSLGHMGIAFKNYHQHYWQNPALLKIAHSLFRKTAALANRESKPTVLLMCGKTALELGDEEAARKDLEEGIKEAKRVKDDYQGAFVLGHLGSLFLKQKKLEEAKTALDRALKTLEKAVEEKPDSLYYQVWISYVELALAEYYLVADDKKQARQWLSRAEKRIEKYDLGVRRLEAQKLRKQIEVATVLVFGLGIQVSNLFLGANG